MLVGFFPLTHHSMHDPLVLAVVKDAAMHRAPIVPDDKITRLPAVPVHRVDVLGMGIEEFDQIGTFPGLHALCFKTALGLGEI